MRAAAHKGWLMLGELDNLSQMLNILPEAQVRVSPKTGGNVVVLPHTLTAATRLSRAGFDVPSPMLDEYQWTGRHAPYAHQKVTSGFLTLNPKCAVLSDMATGKTASAMWAADWLMRIGQVRKVLVLCPLSCVNRVWMDELFKWVPHRSGQLLRGARDRRKRLAKGSQAEFLILNHDGLKVCAHELVNRGDIDIVIADEADTYRNPDTARYRLFVQVVTALRARLWLMTGTPTPNAPTDAWALARLINPFNTPSGFNKFKNQTMFKVSQFKWVPKPDAHIIVRKVLQPAIRFPKNVLKDLPVTTYIERECAMSKEQMKHYEMIRKHLISIDAGQVINALNAAGKMNKLMQICQGSVYTETGAVIDLPMGDRIDVTCELIDASLSKSIVFVPYRHVCDRVQAELERRGYGVAVVHGGVTGGKRDHALQRFQLDDSTQVLVAHPRTASHGLNLQCASTTVWYGPTFSTGQWLQANERMSRTGQAHKMIIAKLASMPVERGAYDTVVINDDRQSRILKLYEEVFK